ncbi:MAG: hypothetical protein RL069_1799, partial [Planctomycetota bacterium]
HPFTVSDVDVSDPEFDCCCRLDFRLVDCRPNGIALKPGCGAFRGFVLRN